MEKNEAKAILGKNLNEFPMYHDQMTADGGLHILLGKILLSAQLGYINVNEMNNYIDEAFKVHSVVKFS